MSSKVQMEIQKNWKNWRWFSRYFTLPSILYRLN